MIDRHWWLCSCVARWRRAGAICPLALKRAGSLPPRRLNHPRAICRRLANHCLRPDITNSTRSTPYRAPPPPPGVNAVAQPFLLACGCSAPKSRPPPFTTCWGLCLRHDLGTVALVAVYVIMICGRFRSRGRCGNGRANLLILWRVLHGFYWLGHSTSLGDSPSLFAPGWVCVLRLAHVEASTGSGALSCGQDR